MLNKPKTEQIFGIKSEKDFKEIALQIFQYQAIHNPILKKFLFYPLIFLKNIKL
jgi:hypothetical protein